MASLGSATARPGLSLSPVLKARWRWECRDRDGNLKWIEEYENLVVTEGRNALLNNTFNAIPGSVAWFVALKNTGAVAAGDTMASHAGWTENTNYTEGTRPAWTKNGAASAGAMSNSAAKAVFSINATTTIDGGFLATDSTKGGTTGTLYGAGDFAAPRSLGSGDSLSVQVDLSATAS